MRPCSPLNEVGENTRVRTVPIWYGLVPMVIRHVALLMSVRSLS